jgi:hypothetical protein
MPFVRIPTFWLKLRVKDDPCAEEALSKVKVHPASGVAVVDWVTLGVALAVRVSVAD